MGDGSTWIISSCDRAVYRFYETKSEVGRDNSPVNPVPVVTFTKNLGPMVEMYGENFSAFLTVWFGKVPSETLYRCEELLLCRPPAIEQFTGVKDDVCRERKEVPLLLVREDGVIYPTGKTYTYEVDHLALLKQAHRRSQGQVQPSSSPSGQHPALGFPSFS